jgi:hypothetical protein
MPLRLIPALETWPLILIIVINAIAQARMSRATGRPLAY